MAAPKVLIKLRLKGLALQQRPDVSQVGVQHVAGVSPLHAGSHIPSKLRWRCRRPSPKHRLRQPAQCCGMTMSRCPTRQMNALLQVRARLVHGHCAC